MQPKNLNMNNKSVVGSKPRRGNPMASDVPSGDRHNYQGEMMQAAPTQTMEDIQKSVMQATEMKMHNKGVYKNADNLKRMATHANADYSAAMAEAQQAFSKAQQTASDYDTMAFNTDRQATLMQDAMAREGELFDGRDKQPKTKTSNGFNEATINSGKHTDHVLGGAVKENPTETVLQTPESPDTVQMYGGSAFTETPADAPSVPKPTATAYMSDRRAKIGKEIARGYENICFDAKQHLSPDQSYRLCVTSKNRDSLLCEYLTQNKDELIGIMGDIIGLPEDQDKSKSICINGAGNTAEIIVSGFDLSVLKDSANIDHHETIGDALSKAVQSKIHDYGDSFASINVNTNHLVDKKLFEESLSNQITYDIPILKYGDAAIRTDRPADTDLPTSTLDNTLVPEKQDDLSNDQPIF